jgi:hypothetical protein
LTWIAFLSLAALLVVLVMATRWMARVPARDLAQALRVFVATLAALLGSGLIYAGRIGFAVAVLGAGFWAIRSFRKARRPPDPFEAAETAGVDADDGVTVRTATLAMRLDPATGELDGTVLRGRHRGKRLSRLGLAPLLELLATCRRDDPESEPLLEAFLDRRHAGWRADGAGARDDAGMTDARAYEILGLEPGADEAAIKDAHRRLMAYLHPDRGGSTYLAAQINEARAHLLDRTRQRR